MEGANPDGPNEGEGEGQKRLKGLNDQGGGGTVSRGGEGGSLWGKYLEQCR